MPSLTSSPLENIRPGRGERRGLSPPPFPPPPCRNCKISIWHSPPRFETRLFNLIPAKSPDAGGCALTTLAVKSSTNRGPGEGLKSGSGEIVGPGSGTLLINPGIYWQAIGCKSAVHKRAIQLCTGQSSLEKETAEVKPTQAFSPNNYWQAIGCKSAVHKRAIQLSTGQSSLEKETAEVKPTQAFSPNIYLDFSKPAPTQKSHSETFAGNITAVPVNYGLATRHQRESLLTFPHLNWEFG